MISRKPKEETPTPWWRSGGFAVCAVACVIFFQVFTDRPPKYESLVSSEAQVTRVPYLKWHLKGLDRVAAPLDTVYSFLSMKKPSNWSYPAIDLDGSRVWIATGFQSHASSREMYELAAGDKIQVWTWIEGGEKFVWHVTHRNRTLLAYEDVAKRDADNRQLFLYVAIGILVFGLVLVILRI